MDQSMRTYMYTYTHTYIHTYIQCAMDEGIRRNRSGEKDRWKVDQANHLAYPRRVASNKVKYMYVNVYVYVYVRKCQETRVKNNI